VETLQFLKTLAIEDLQLTFFQAGIILKIPLHRNNSNLRNSTAFFVYVRVMPVKLLEELKSTFKNTFDAYISAIFYFTVLIHDLLLSLFQFRTCGLIPSIS
jgi:hypothetical protein